MTTDAKGTPKESTARTQADEREVERQRQVYADVRAARIARGE